METEKILDYIFKIIVVILLIVLIFIDKKETCISNNTFKDSVILIYKDTAVYFQKEIIKNHYEYKIDSVIVSYMPDSLLFPEIMRLSREILQYEMGEFFGRGETTKWLVLPDGGFTETDINGTDKGTALPDGNRTIEDATQNVRECNRYDTLYKNSSEH